MICRQNAVICFLQCCHFMLSNRTLGDHVDDTEHECGNKRNDCQDDKRGQFLFGHRAQPPQWIVIGNSTYWLPPRGIS